MLAEVAIMVASVAAVTLGSLRFAAAVMARDNDEMRDPRFIALEERRRIAERKRSSAVRHLYVQHESGLRQEARKMVGEAENELVAIAREEMKLRQE